MQRSPATPRPIVIRHSTLRLSMLRRIPWVTVSDTIMFLIILALVVAPMTRELFVLMIKSSTTSVYAIGLVLGALLLFLNLKLNNLLESQDKVWLEYSLWKSKINMSLGLLNRRNLVAIPYTALLVVAVPALAALEELVFRSWTITPIGFVVSTILFGVVHLLAGVSVRMSIVNTHAGFWLAVLFVSVYSAAGFIPALWLATVAHATHNFIAVGWAWQQRLTKESIVT